jgi:signal transduction histidine kinase
VWGSGSRRGLSVTVIDVSAPGRQVALERSLNVMADQVETESRDLVGLAEQQAALQRITALVARAAPPEELFSGLIEWVGQLLPVDLAHLARYEQDGTLTFVATWSRAGDLRPDGARFALGGKNLATIVFHTGRPARLDSFSDASGPIGLAARESGTRSGVATPIVVEGRLWGVMAAASMRDERIPSDIEQRLALFTELLASAIASAESRAELARVAGEQAALRRVATLVARGAPPEELFAAVAEEVGELLRVDHTGMSRYESDGTMTVLAAWSRSSEAFPILSRWGLGGNNIPTLVAETGRPARFDSHAEASGPLGVAARERGSQGSVGTPIVVEGRLWGVMVANATVEQPLPRDAEARLASFTDLLATAIANAESRAALDASRARIVAAADETRRRIERDLHDGAQQRLVSLGLELRAAQATLPPGLGELDGELSRVAQGLASVQEELREIARGIHPAILAEGGLGPALKTLARRSPTPVALDVRVEARLPERVEVATYYVVSEALTNAAKHARASAVHVEVEAADDVVRLSVRDDGAGGADPTRGSGLVGLKDRVETLGGTITVESPSGEGTTVYVELPLGRDRYREP